MAKLASLGGGIAEAYNYYPWGYKSENNIEGESTITVCDQWLTDPSVDLLYQRAAISTVT